MKLGFCNLYRDKAEDAQHIPEPDWRVNKLFPRVLWNGRGRKEKTLGTRLKITTNERQRPTA